MLRKDVLMLEILELLTLGIPKHRVQVLNSSISTPNKYIQLQWPMHKDNA